MRCLVSLLANPLIIEDKTINLWNQNTFKKTSDNIHIPDTTSYNWKCWLRQLIDLFLSPITLNWEHLKGVNYLLEEAPSLGRGQCNIQSLSELMPQSATRCQWEDEVKIHNDYFFFLKKKKVPSKYSKIPFICKYSTPVRCYVLSCRSA